jgi:hypothetical protein
MANLPKIKRDVSTLKPLKFQDHRTIGELAREVDRDVSWIRALEADGRIPKAIRVRRGRLQVRLWSPEQVEEIKEIFRNMRPGRPPGS